MWAHAKWVPFLGAADALGRGRRDLAGRVIVRRENRKGAWVARRMENIAEQATHQARL